MCADDQDEVELTPPLSATLDDIATHLPTVESLSAPPPTSAAQLKTSLDLWRTNGLVIFPSLLDQDDVDALLAHVRSAQHGNHTADYTAVVRTSRQGPGGPPTW